MFVVKLNIYCKFREKVAFFHQNAILKAEGCGGLRHYPIRNYIAEGQLYNMRRGSCSEKAQIEEHSHEFIELVYVLNGGGTHRINKSVYEAQRGSLLFVNVGDVHHYSTTDTMGFVNLYLHPLCVGTKRVADIYSILCALFSESDRLPQPFPQHIQLSGSILTEFERLIECLHRELRQQQHGYSAVVNGYMQAVFALILRALLPKQERRSGKLLTAELLDYIEKNYTKRLTLTELAARFYYHPVYLGRLFHETFQVSFKDYLCEKRLQHAERQLLESSLTIDEVAVVSGFSDKKFFYKTFREKHGCTPMQYRKQGE